MSSDCDEGHPRLEERGQFLVEDDEFLTADRAAGGCPATSRTASHEAAGRGRRGPFPRDHDVTGPHCRRCKRLLRSRRLRCRADSGTPFRQFRPLVLLFRLDERVEYPNTEFAGVQALQLGHARRHKRLVHGDHDIDGLSCPELRGGERNPPQFATSRRQAEGVYDRIPQSDFRPSEAR